AGGPRSRPGRRATACRPGRWRPGLPAPRPGPEGFSGKPPEKLARVGKPEKPRSGDIHYPFFEVFLSTRGGARSARIGNVWRGRLRAVWLGRRGRLPQRTGPRDPLSHCSSTIRSAGARFLQYRHARELWFLSETLRAPQGGWEARAL